jgi:hypothetical protein
MKIKYLLLTFITVILLDGTFDITKWAIGRYTEISPAMSICMILGFSALMALAVEYIHRYRAKRERRYEQYIHHGHWVWVRRDIKGKHWEPTICLDCAKYRPDTHENCPIAEDLFGHCKEYHLALAVFECPMFKED